MLLECHYFAQAIMFICAAAGLSKSDASQSIVGALVICSVLV
jgi:hypothetical protein